MDIPRFDPRVRELVQAGVIVVDIHLARDGACVTARCTQPHPRLGLRACDIHTVEDIVRLLEKYKVPQPASGTPPSKKVEVSSKFRPSLAPQHVVNHGVKNQLPLNSLCFNDFGLDDTGFTNRVFKVAQNVGNAKIVSRITTDLKNLEVRGVGTLRRWWEGATPMQRWYVLTNSKKVGTAPTGCTYNVLPGSWTDLLMKTPCPFRNADVEIHTKGSRPEDNPEGYAYSEEESDKGVLVD